MNMDLEKEWTNQGVENEKLRIMQEATELAQEQPHEDSLHGADNLKATLIELITKYDHYQIGKMRLYHKRIKGLFSNKTKTVRIRGALIQWKSGKLTLLWKCPVPSVSPIRLSPKEWQNWKDKLKTRQVEFATY